MSRRADLVVLDVRSPGEFDGLRIPGSHNVPVEEIRRHPDKVAKVLTGPTAILCAQGMRSEEAARILSQAGGSDLRLLQGGIRAWQSAGGKIEEGKGRWALDRQMRLAAGSVALAGLMASTAFGPAKWVAGFVAGGLAYSAVTDRCGAAKLLMKLPYNNAPDYNLDAVLSGIAAPTN